MATLLEYKCPCCGGALSFESSLQKMQCPYCDTEFDVQSLQEMDAVLETPQEDTMDWQQESSNTWQEGEEDGLYAYVCQSCGGQIVGDAAMAATSCPYCDNLVVIAGKLAGDLKPDLVIPFKLSKADAEAALTKHLTGKPLLPKIFKSENRIKEIKGMYVPFWLFDAHADGNASFHATRVRTWSDSNYHYTETKHYRILRSGDLRFAGVPADGSQKMADDLMESIEPYDLSEAVDFQTAYLAGYLADRYDLSAADCVPRVNTRIKASTEQALRDTIYGYSTVTTENCAVTLDDTHTRYALYPVWILSTKYKDQIYTFAMNGQTGRFVGNLPINWAAFWAWLIGLTVGVGSLAMLIATALGYL